MTINVQNPDGTTAPASTQQLAAVRADLGVPTAAEVAAVVAASESSVLAQVPAVAASVVPAVASEVEATGGLNDSKIMTPAKVAAAITARGGSGSGVPQTSPASTTINLDATVRQYDPLTIAGATTILLTGTTKGAYSAMTVIANGTHVPTVSGGTEWGTSFGYLNSNGVPNVLAVTYDGLSRLYTWTRAAVVAAAPAPDTTAPLFVSAAVENANPAKIILNYSDASGALSPTLTGSISVGGSASRTVSSQTVVGMTVEVVVNAPYANGDTITVTVPNGCVRDGAGNGVTALTAASVTNNVNPADVSPPSLLSAVVPNATRSKIVLTYNEALSTTLTGSATVGGPSRTVSTQTVVGSTVEVVVSSPYAFGDAPTISVPSGWARDTTGNSAAALTNQAISNNIVESGSQDTVTTDWLARLSTAGGTASAPTISAVDTFFATLRTNGLIGKLTRINLCVGNDLTSSLVPQIILAGNTVDTAFAAPGYSEALGWSTNGTSQYIGTGCVPTSAITDFGVYLRTALPSNSTAYCMIGTGTTDDAYRLIANRNPGDVSGDGRVSALIGRLVGNPGYNPGGAAPGAYHAIRRSNSDAQLFRNGSSVATNTTPISGAAGASTGYTLFVQNTASVVTASTFMPNASRLATYWVGDGTMTAGECATFYTALQTFQTAMSRNV